MIPALRAILTTIPLLGAYAIAGNTENGNITQLSGTSIVGNTEAPKSLYIVPWHSPDITDKAALSPALPDGDMQPVDRDEFIRELGIYRLEHDE